MSFIQTDAGKAYAPGFFLASEDCTRITTEIAQSGATTVGSAKYVKAGTPYPSNDGNAVGIVYEDVDVTSGDMPGSIVTAGIVYKDRLPVTIDDSAVSALTGITFITSAPSRTFNPWLSGDLIPLTVTSEASATAAGKTKITYTGYTLKTGETLKYKTDSSTAPTVALGNTTWTGWNSWNGTDEISATTGHKITIAVADNAGAAIASGSATVTSKASG